MVRILSFSLITFLFVGTSFSYASSEDNFEELTNFVELPNNLGPSGFLLQTEDSMQSLGYLYQDFDPIKDPINKQYEPEYLQRYKMIYSQFLVTILGIYNYYVNETNLENLGEIEPTLNSERTFQDGSNVWISFCDAEEMFITPAVDFMHAKLAQKLHGEFGLSDALMQSSTKSLSFLEEAQKLGMQEIRNQTYTVWYLLMFRSAFERKIRTTIEEIQEILSQKETLLGQMPTLEEKARLTTNTSEEEQLYQEALFSVRWGVQDYQDNIDRLQSGLKSDMDDYLSCLRSPNDPNYRVGYGTQHGVAWTVYYNMGWSDHPRVEKNRNLIFPLILPEDVEWACERLKTGIENRWQGFNDEEEIEIPYDYIFLEG